MWLPLETVTNNISMSMAYLVPFIAFICGLTFYAINFKLGSLLNMVIFFAIFAWFYEAGINYVPAIIFGFVSLVMLAFSLYAVSSRDAAGGRLT